VKVVATAERPAIYIYIFFFFFLMGVRK